MGSGERPGAITGRWRALGKQNLGYDIVGKVHIAVHGKESPADPEWQAYLEHVKSRIEGLEGILLLAVTSGPTDAQRDQAVEFWKAQPRTQRIAVVTALPQVTRMAGALKWFMPDQIRSFSPNAIHLAYDHLGLTPAHLRSVETSIANLRSRLGIAGG